MPGLPWFRMDANLATHDKILELMETKGRAKGRAIAFGWACSVGYSVGHGTDGLILMSALPMVHLTKSEAHMLVEAGLFDLDPRGFRIHNFADYQQLSKVSVQVKESQSIGGRKGACIKHHGAACGCWKSEAMTGA